jgi:hypothetical protein
MSWEGLPPVAGVMIGREAWARPWMLRCVHALLCLGLSSSHTQTHVCLTFACVCVLIMASIICLVESVVLLSNWHVT